MQQVSADDVRRDIDAIHRGHLKESIFRFDLAGHLWTVEMERGRSTEELFESEESERRVNVRYYLGTEDVAEAHSMSESPGNEAHESFERILASYPVDRMNRSAPGDSAQFHLHGDDRELDTWAADELGSMGRYSRAEYAEEYGVGPVDPVTLARTSVELFGIVFDLRVEMMSHERMRIVFIDPNDYGWHETSIRLPAHSPGGPEAIAEQMVDTAMGGVRNYITSHPTTTPDRNDSFADAAELKLHR